MITKLFISILKIPQFSMNYIIYEYSFLMQTSYIIIQIYFICDWRNLVYQILNVIIKTWLHFFTIVVAYIESQNQNIKRGISAFIKSKRSLYIFSIVSHKLFSSLF